MSTIIPHSELRRRALQWIIDELREAPQKKVPALVDEASMRFNLGPQDSNFLLEFFRKEKEQPGPVFERRRNFTVLR